MSIHPLHQRHNSLLAWQHSSRPIERRAMPRPRPDDPGPMALPPPSAWHGLVIGTGLALLCAALVIAGVYSARASMPTHGLKVAAPDVVKQTFVTQPSRASFSWQTPSHVIATSSSDTAHKASPRSLFM
ncbi:hypothetical protein [Cobetia sp. L2A1]|uniref:hypothetical protein n=1 Tax=Cobetia sp. L2A1 TaxID=2686360 RepID=UPI00131D2B01|nr:hypothetical protein [Cobetia sp. L2A1]